jgi:hypothetical protein
LSNSSVGSAATSGGLGGARKSQVIASATFSLRLSFAELFEETITVGGGHLECLVPASL